MNTSTPIILPLATANASLEVVGGKGRSLAVLASAGLPVPAGFLLTTSAYKAFVEANELRDSILALVDAANGRLGPAEKS